MMAPKQLSPSEPGVSDGPGDPGEPGVPVEPEGPLRAFIWTPDGQIVEVDGLPALEKAYADPTTRIWIDVESASADTLSSIAGCLDLHVLTAEDIIERNQRAKIDQLQDDVLSRPSRWVVERLFQVRRDLLTIRHTVSPEREVFNQLTNRGNSLIASERIVYFRDVYDHLIRLNDELDSYREMVSTTLDAYLSTINNDLSTVMRRLTAVTAVLAGAGAVAGIFGMSEVGLALGFQDVRFWLVASAIVALSLGGFLYFRRIDWI